MPTTVRSKSAGIPIHFLGLLVLLAVLAVGCVSPVETGETDTSLGETGDERAPAELTSFTIHVADGGFVKEQIQGRVAYLHQAYHIAHVRSIHVDFYKKGREGKETLDAPEGYLYLKDLTGADTITSGHPFYEEIGGKEANIDLLTSPTAVARGLPERIERYSRDIDLIGRPARKIVYRRVDGSEAVCLRAYRQNPPNQPPVLFGVGDVEYRRRQPNSDRPTVMRGDIFIANDTLTSITVKGAPQIRTPQ